MSAMKALATELEEFWTLTPNGVWSRILPDGRPITIAPRASAKRGWYQLIVDHRGIAEVDTLAEAIVAAGSIARNQLANEARTWAA